VAFNKKTPPKPPAALSSAASTTPIVITTADGLGFRRHPPKMPAPRPPAFRDRMQQTRHSPVYNAAEQIPEPPSTRRSTRNSANTCNPIPVEDPEPQIPGWSKQNTDWEENWNVSLTFQRTTVDKEDIPRLDEGECLNDNLIGFLMRWIFDQFSKKVKNLAQRVYVHNTFFYTTLKSGGRSYHHINYDGVKNWTSKVDLLSYDYVIVPVNEHFHWWMAIICNPGKLDRDARLQSADEAEDSDQMPKDEREMPMESGDPNPSPDMEMADATDQHLLTSGGSPTAELAPSPAGDPKSEGGARHVPAPPSAEGDIVDLVDVQPVVSDLAASECKPTKRGRKSGGPPPRVYDIKDPRIITLDSLGASHTPAVASLRAYLAKEFEHKRNKVLEALPQQLGMKAVGLPEQDNFNDCGVYLLAYFQEFVRDPDQFVKALLHKEKTKWEMNPAEYRTDFRDTILREQKRYQNNLGRGQATNKIPVETSSKSPVKTAEPAPTQKSPAAPQPQEPPKTKPSLPPARSPGQSSRTLRPSSSPANPPGAWPDNDAPSGDEVMLLQPAKDVALASVEPAPPPPEASTTDEITFLRKLPDSSPPRTRFRGLRPSPIAKKDQQPKPAAALPPRTIQTVPSRPQTRSLQNSPAATTTRAQPTLPMHKSPYFSHNVPVVENAKMVMSSEDDRMAGKGDAIDLTEEEDAVKTRRKKDASIDLTGMD
jgi:sentrin-specific protease 7